MQVPGPLVINKSKSLYFNKTKNVYNVACNVVNIEDMYDYLTFRLLGITIHSTFGIVILFQFNIINT